MVFGDDVVPIVLHHDDRIAEIAEAKQSLEQTPVIPLMEADRRFVQDVQDADQARPDLGGETNTLTFAA